MLNKENFIFEFLKAGLFIAVISYFSYVTLKIYNLRRKYAHIPGPPAKGIIGFYFGNFFEIISNETVNKKVTNDLVLDWYDSFFFFSFFSSFFFI